MADLPNSNDTDEKKFLGFCYIEIKDLSKHFLTVITAVLAFSITFSEKIIDFASAKWYQKAILISSWGMFITAVILCGLAIFVNYVTATIALRGESNRIRRLVRKLYLILDSAGVIFVLGLIMLALSVTVKFFNG